MLGDQYFVRLAQIESSGNPKAQNPKSSAGGLFQFTDATAKAYGLKDKFDPEQSLEAATRLTDDNRRVLKGRLGREPREGELYLAHQQGASGASRLLENPDAPAVKIVGEDAVRLNGGDADMTAQEFANKWINKFEGGNVDLDQKRERLEKLQKLKALRDQKAQLGAQSAPQEQTQVPNVPEPQESVARTAFDQGMQGATIGLSDEASDPLGALIATAVFEPKALLTGEPTNPALIEQLSGARKGTQDRLERQFKQRPVTSILANIVGAAGTGVAGAATKAGAAAGNILRSGNLAARASKASVVGTASGAAFGTGTAEDGKRGEGARKGALVGAAVGAAAPVIGKAASGINKSLGKKSPIPNADDLRKQASALYKKADELGGVLKENVTDDFLDSVGNLKPQTQAGKLIQGDTPFTKIADQLESLRGRKISLQEAQEIDEFLGDAIDGFTDVGRLTKQGKKILDIQTAFRNQIEDVSEEFVEGGKEGFKALKEGRKLWSTSRKLADIERIIQRAELMDNPATGIKTGFRTLLSNPKRLKGYTKAEKAAIKKAAETGLGTEVLRLAGSRLIGIITAGSGGGLGATAGVSAASAASRNAASALQVGKAKKLTDLVANKGAPARQGLIRARTPRVGNNPLIAAGEKIRD